jgi:uncharacterized Zn-binding protein involved in type VI secretion
MMCTFGLAPSTLVVLPVSRVMVNNMPAANIMDSAPMVNIPPFGMCNSLSNPTVAAATAAALGVLTPMPCLPTPVGPWKPGSPTVMVGGKPALNNQSMCNCAFGGVITFSFAGQATTMVP